MSTAVPTSSDDIRTAKPLRYAKRVTFDGPFQLEHGGVLPAVHVTYETYGTLSPHADNAILICHALSGDSHVARHDAEDDPGWWDLLVGPGKPIDTDRFFVVCPNNLGGCRGTTGPAEVNPATGKPWGADFPVITVGDMVAVQRKLVQHLGIRTLLAVIGGSMGGHQTLHWATAYPEEVRGAIAMATSARLTSQALAFDVVGRNAILRDPHFHGGQYYDKADGPGVGLALARMLAHITYLSPHAMAEKFDADRLAPRDITTEFEKKFSVGSYLAYQGHRFVERFDANSYISLTMAMDMFDLGMGETLAENLAKSTCRWLILSFSTDWLFPPHQSQEMAEALLARGRPVTYCEITSTCGHDAFLLENDIDRYGELVRSFLEHLPERRVRPMEAIQEEETHSETSIFHAHRLDYDLIQELIPGGASVLDLGCGTGGLLGRLLSRGHTHLLGVEWDEYALVAASRYGIDVVRADLNAGLGAFAQGQFDVVVLSQTLQTVRDVDKVVDAMLRVGRKGIVSFPNLAYAPLRRQLMEEGRAPRASPMLGFTWHESPNIRFLSIADFEDYCRLKGIRIHQSVALETQTGRRVEADPNLNADTAIFVISR